MKIFKRDMKIMYEITGKKVLKDIIKMELIIILFTFFLILALDIPLYVGIIALILPIVGMVGGYFKLYFGDYRQIFREIEKEIDMQNKYNWYYEKFIETK